GKILLMDGAMGTELIRAALPDGQCFDLRSLTHPDQIRGIHRSYIKAGARCLLTNTFQSNPPALARHGLGDKLSEICTAAVALARSVAGADHFVIGDIGPILESDGSTEFADQAEMEQVVSCLAGADAILLETCSDPAALQAARWCAESLGDRNGA